jgi:hypothetical protein
MTSRNALALCAFTVLAFLFAGCGDEDDDGQASPNAAPDPAATSTAGRDASNEPILSMPASLYALTVDDLGAANGSGATFLTDVQRTYVLDAENYGRILAPDGGETLLRKWGYAGGYETAFIPDGRDSAVLNGAYYAVLEVHLFDSPEGAAKAFHHFEHKLKSSPAKRTSAPGVGNESSAWTMTAGKVTNSNTPRVHHTVLFRRGNLVAIILATGAEGHVGADTVGHLADLIDDRALGAREPAGPAPVPTRSSR